MLKSSNSDNEIKTAQAVQVALITGGTSGIGLKCAENFIRRGFRVLLMGRSRERGEAAIEGLTACTRVEQANNKAEQPSPEEIPDIKNVGQVSFLQGDVSQVADCNAAVKAAEAMGQLVVLVNSAGIYFERAIEDMSEFDFAEMLDINLKGTYFMTKYAAEVMKQQGYGAIVNISSDAGLHANMLCSAYCASKGAVNMFTRAAALELSPYGIRINAVCPGDIMTPLTEGQLRQYPDREAAIREMSSVYPIGRIGSPEEVADVVDFLASDKAGFITGAIWTVDGGITA